MSKGIDVKDIKKLTTFEGARTNTFKVCIKASDYDKALKPEVWPLRVGVRLFRPKRTFDGKPSPWAQQSAKSGGNIQAQATTDHNSSNPPVSENVATSVITPLVTTPATPVTTSNRFSLLGRMGSSSEPQLQN